MTTLELIEQTRKCADSYGCDECFYYNAGECNNSVMMKRLADRLEMAYKILEIITHYEYLCEVCKHSHDDGTCDVTGMCTFEIGRDLYDNT